MSYTPKLTLNDGHAMPQVGQGVYQVPEGDTARIVDEGIAAGYRLIDTAMIYGNEAGVGEAVRASGETIFVTTKLWNADQGRDTAARAFDTSFAALGLDWIDLYLIHWPVPQRGLTVETWAALVALREEGQVRSIGVSNFRIEDLERVIDATGVVPATNQIELHPAFPQDELVAFHRERGIVTTSWSPLGRGQLFGDPAIAAIAQKHGRTPAQVILRWHLERGLAVIPKASSPARLAENLDLFSFALDDEDMARIATLARADGRTGPEPATFGG